MMPIGERLFAALYDPLGARWEQKYGARLRRELLADARGRVLEIGVGTGLSLAHYPDVDEIVGIDPSGPMLRHARSRAGEKVTLVQAPAEELPFEDDSFDTAVAIAVLCTVRDPARALHEIRRVLRPDGRFIFAEHVRADDPKLATWQDRLERPWGFIAGGCHPNRRTREAVEAAGFELTKREEGELPGLPRLIRPSVRATAIPR